MVFSVLLNSVLLPALGEDSIRVERDKDKTVYTIGSNEGKNEVSDRDRSWQMLNNMSIIHERSDKREHDGKGQDNNR